MGKQHQYDERTKRSSNFGTEKTLRKIHQLFLL